MRGSASVQDSLARLQWGDHACHLFASGEDLGEILVPYFKAGLERDEAGLWVTGSPYGTDRAVSEMRTAMPDFDRRAAAGQIQIVGYDEWYTKRGALSAAETIRGWMLRKEEALAAGYAGLRITGNTSFLDESTWNNFMDYERSLDVALRGQRILTLCSYCLRKCSVDATIDVMCSHGFSLARRHGAWRLLDFKRPAPAVAGSPWSTVAAILEDQLTDFAVSDPGRIELAGDPAPLSKKQATRLAVVVQELVLNATRHGALASPQGRISVQWHLTVNGSRRLYIKWVESGLLHLDIPEDVRFGTRLIAQLVDNCVRVYEPSGMTCTFDLGLASDDAS
jgi:hypothetical protein